MNFPTLSFDPALNRSVRAALVWGLDMPDCSKTESEPPYISELLKRVKAAGETFIRPSRKTAIRGMLRFGKYKPTGRGKPSSEYLLAAALNGEFPLVNGPVDVNNAVSLECGYPASIFDMQLSGPELFLRRGTAGESYVFNPSGQIIDLEDLLCVCRKEADAWSPCGNPVKDSMATKTRESTRHVAAVIYVPATEPVSDLEAAGSRFAALLGSECRAAQTGHLLVTGAGAD
jgi:DNA/RNA-binding domain of Phe-tRNA-synthetase-like protein